MKTFTRALFFLLLVPTFVFAQTNQRVVPYGRSCSSATIGWQGMPDTGDTFYVTVSGAPANSLVGLFVGFSDRKWVSAGLPLPQKLYSWGAPNCALYASPDLTFTAMTDPSGNASFPIQIPNSPAYNGRKLYAQAFIPQPGANPLGITFTQALRFVIRQPIVMRDTIGANSSYTDGNYGAPNYTNITQSSFTVNPSTVSALTAPAILKSIRLIGYPGVNPTMSCFDWSARVWDSHAAALSSPTTGNVGNATITAASPDLSIQPFGTAPTGFGGSPSGLSYEVALNMLNHNISLQAGVPYAITAVAVKLCPTVPFFVNTESTIIPGPTDWCVTPTTAMPNLQCQSPLLPPFQTGVNAIKIVASLLQ